MARKKPTPLKSPEVCPVCGEDVPNNSLACPECGADHDSGWREDFDIHDAAGLPEDDFDYDEFVKQEFGSSPKPAGLKPVWWITAILLPLAFIAFCLYALR